MKRDKSFGKGFIHFYLPEIFPPLLYKFWHGCFQYLYSMCVKTLLKYIFEKFIVLETIKTNATALLHFSNDGLK